MGEVLGAEEGAPEKEGDAVTYVDTAREALLAEINKLPEEKRECPPELADLYTVLVLTLGPLVTLADVHDAWAIWRSRTKPEHKDLVPFDQLSAGTQEWDRPYVVAIAAAARVVKK